MPSCDGLHVYVVAHQDDWMLFRGDHAARQLEAEHGRVVFIHTTAGDAGTDEGWWEARELATVMAVRRFLGEPPLRISRPRVRGHGLQRYCCSKAVLYFLRCADGGKRGEGYRLHRHSSLSRLRDCGRPLLTVDGSSRYRSWDDFCRMLARIVARERRACLPRHPAAATWIHSGDYDPATNPGDHADHRATADAVRTFAAPCGYGRSWFLTYCSRDRPANLETSEAAAKYQLFEAYGKELGRLMGSSGSLNLQEWAWWGQKSYGRWMAPGTGDPDVPDQASDPPHAARPQP